MTLRWPNESESGPLQYTLKVRMPDWVETELVSRFYQSILSQPLSEHTRAGRLFPGVNGLFREGW